MALVELCWVLGSSLGLDRSKLVDALEALLRTTELMVEQAEVVWKSVRVCRHSAADFADCLIEPVGTAAGCERTHDLRLGAAKHSGMILIAASPA